MRAGRLLGELWRSAPGKAGLVLLALLVAVSVFVVAFFPRDFGPSRWSNPALWADYPRSAPPAWTNLLARDRRAAHQLLQRSRPSRVVSSGGIIVAHYEMPFSFDATEPPTFLSCSLAQVSFSSAAPIMSVRLVRPDGGAITLHREAIRGPREGESAPYRRLFDEPLRVALVAEPRSLDQVAAFFHDRYGADISRERLEASWEASLFGVPEAGHAQGFRVLAGEYAVDVELEVANPQDGAGLVRVAVGGSVYGAMGTDALGRDLAQGLLFGLPVALLIGILTSVVSTLLGMSLGLAGGYAGGATDAVIQRAADIVANVPVLPLLIFLVFIGGSRLPLILLVLVAFSWPGLTITVRSMVLQLKTGQEVESARALGASALRVVSRHILPHTASYLLAQLVFSAPSAILAEAGLSFLGLGDPTIPTWGQILEYGFRTGAVFLGYWWWVVPPGFLIVLTAVTFMFLALGLEPVVDPRLRGRRLWRS